jgi:hypothetical protein
MTTILLLSTVLTACVEIVTGPPPPANSPVNVDKKVLDTQQIVDGVFIVQFEAVISLPTARSGVVLTDTLTNVKDNLAVFALPDPFEQSNPSNGRFIARKQLGDLAPGTYTVRYAALIGQECPNSFNTYSNDATITDRNGFVARDTLSFTLRGCGTDTATTTTGMVPADDVALWSGRLGIETQ